MAVQYVTRLPAIRRNVRPQAQHAISRAVFDTVAEARIAAPFRTGNLKSSIGGETGELSGRVSVGAEYGIYVELGTRYMAARPYLRPAFDRASDKLLKDLAGIV